MVAVIFVATVIRSAFGFGEALIATPLLSLVISVEVVVPLAVLASITVAVVVVVAQHGRKVHSPPFFHSNHAAASARRASVRFMP